MEKKNDVLRRNFHRKINRFDACASLLQIEKRQEKLSHLQRQKRPYIFSDVEFWEEGGRQEAMRKIARISTAEPYYLEQPSTEMSVFNKDELMKKSIKDLEVMLKELQPEVPVRRKQRKADLVQKIMEHAS